MNRTKAALLVTFAYFLSAHMIHSESATKHSTGTIVVTIKGQDVVQLSKAGQKINKKLQDEQDRLSKPLQKKEQEIKEKEQKLLETKKKLDKEFEELTKNSLLSNEAKQRKFEELQDKARNLEEDKSEIERLIKHLQNDAKRLDAKMSQMYQEEMGKFDAKIKDIIRKVAKREGWDIVLMEESVVFASESVSKTDIIVKELDKDEPKTTSEDSLLKEIKKDVNILEDKLFG